MNWLLAKSPVWYDHKYLSYRLRKKAYGESLTLSAFSLSENRITKILQFFQVSLYPHSISTESLIYLIPNSTWYGRFGLVLNTSVVYASWILITDTEKKLCTRYKIHEYAYLCLSSEKVYGARREEKICTATNKFHLMYSDIPIIHNRASVTLLHYVRIACTFWGIFGLGMSWRQEKAKKLLKYLLLTVMLRVFPEYKYHTWTLPSAPNSFCHALTFFYTATPI